MDLFFVEMDIQPYFNTDLQWSHMKNMNLPKVGKILFCILRNTRKLPVENKILRGCLEIHTKGCPRENKFIKFHGSKATWTNFPTLIHVQEFLQGLS